MKCLDAHRLKPPAGNAVATSSPRQFSEMMLTTRLIIEIWAESVTVTNNYGVFSA